MKKTLIRAFIRVRKRFDRVWSEKYPGWWHIIDLIAGIIMGVAFAITFEANIWIKISLFFAITLLGYLITLAFTYGVVRARNGWTKKT